MLRLCIGEIRILAICAKHIDWQQTIPSSYNDILNLSNSNHLSFISGIIMYLNICKDALNIYDLQCYVLFNLYLASSPNAIGLCCSFNNITVFGFVLTEYLVDDHPEWTNTWSLLANAYDNADQWSRFTNMRYIVHVMTHRNTYQLHPFQNQDLHEFWSYF